MMQSRARIQATDRASPNTEVGHQSRDSVAKRPFPEAVALSRLSSRWRTFPPADLAFARVALTASCLSSFELRDCPVPLTSAMGGKVPSGELAYPRGRLPR
jgi:hypothetical protein